jgi:hypothetical protein
MDKYLNILLKKPEKECKNGCVHGICHDGQCVCNEGYEGIDCSIPLAIHKVNI